MPSFSALENIFFVRGPGPDLLEVKSAFVNATASGNTQVVALVSGKRIRVLSAMCTNNGGSNITVRFQRATTNITAPHMLASNGGGWVRTPKRWAFETAITEALNVNLSAAGDVGVEVEYVEYVP